MTAARDDDLDRHLTAIATALVAEAPAAPAPPPSALRRAGGWSAPPARVGLAVATAAAVSVGVIGMATLARDNDPSPRTVADSSVVSCDLITTPATSLQPELYPALDTERAALVDVVAVEGPRPPADLPFVELLVGRQEGDRLVDTVTIETGYGLADPGGYEPETIEINGVPATRWSPTLTPGATIVTWGDGLRFRAFGTDPIALLDQLIPGHLDVTTVGCGEPEIALDLPDGLDLITAPQLVGPTWTPVLIVGGNPVSTSSRSPLPSLAVIGTPLRIDVDGIEVWTLAEQHVTTVRWQVGDSTWATLKMDDGRDLEAALAIVEALEFVDRDEWLARYPDVEIAGTTEPPADR